MDVYKVLKDHYSNDPRVTVNSGTGAQGIKIKIKNKDKMLIMFFKGDLLLQMPAATVDELIEKGKGLPYEVSTGRIMKERILVPASKKRSWILLCERTIEESSSL